MSHKCTVKMKGAESIYPFYSKSISDRTNSPSRYLSGKTSLSVLDITRLMFAQILTFHQVMPAYLEFVMAFGQQDEPKDLRFSSFKKQVSLASSARLPEIPGLGRSGQQYQLCYNLKHIAVEKGRGFSMIRQAAIHHQFDVVTGKTLWIVTAGRRSLQERYKGEYCGAIC